MSIQLLTTQSEIETAILSIGTKAVAYKTVVSSAVLSSTQHYRTHGDFTLLQGALDAVFAVNYRDYQAVVEFIKSLTWVGLSETKSGRRSRFEIVGDLSDAMGTKPADVTAKDWGDRKKAVADQVTIRQGLFNNFATDIGVPVKNLDWAIGMPKEEKKIIQKYGCDIFAWYDDVKYLRSVNDNGGDSDNGSSPALRTLSVEQTAKLAATFEDRLLNSVNKPVASTVIHILERFEMEADVFVTPEEEEKLRARLEHFINRAKARYETQQQIEAEKKAAAEEATNGDNVTA